MYLNTNLGYIYFEKYGKGPPIIFLHGYKRTEADFIPLSKVLKENYTCYLLRLPFANNVDNLVKYDLNSLTNILDTFIEKLNLKNITVISHSFGTRIITNYLYKYQNIKNRINNKVISQVIIGGAGIKRHKLKTFIKIKLFKIRRNIYKKQRRYDKYQDLIKNSGSSDYKNASDIEKQSLNSILPIDMRKMYKFIDVKTLLVYGKNDNETPYKDGLVINRHIKNSKLIIMNKTGHFCFIENPIYFTNILLSFLEESTYDRSN